MEYYSKLSLVVHYWWSNSELRLVWSLTDDHVLLIMHIYDIKLLVPKKCYFESYLRQVMSAFSVLIILFKPIDMCRYD